MNMKPNMNRKGLYALVCALMGLTFGMLTSCSDDLDVQQSYPFTVETMPVPTRIVKGETVEIRCECLAPSILPAKYNIILIIPIAVWDW